MLLDTQSPNPAIENSPSSTRDLARIVRRTDPIPRVITSAIRMIRAANLSIARERLAVPIREVIHDEDAQRRRWK